MMIQNLQAKDLGATQRACYDLGYHWSVEYLSVEEFDELRIGWQAVGIEAPYLGQRSVEAGTASFIINTTPALSAVLAAVFLGERLRLLGIVGVAISLAGVGVIALSDDGGLAFDYSMGALILLAAAIVHAIHFVYQKATLAAVSPFAVTFGSMLAGALCLLPFAPGSGAALLHASSRGLIAVLYLGICCSALAHLAWSHLLAHLSASRATSILMLNSPMAALIGALWLGEVIPLAGWVGGLLTIGGVALVQLRAARR